MNLFNIIVRTPDGAMHKIKSEYNKTFYRPQHNGLLNPSFEERTFLVEEEDKRLREYAATSCQIIDLPKS